MNKRKTMLIAAILLIIFLLLVPIKTTVIGSCDNVPFPERLSLLRGDSIDEESEKLGGNNACPSVELKLYVL